MILPSKHLPQDRALLTIGARLLRQLSDSKTVSALWEDFHQQGDRKADAASSLGYDEFVLALDLLFLMGTIELRHGLISRSAS